MFNVGDVVQLKSGGPAMTVVLVGMNDGVRELVCVWFVANKPERSTFPEAALEATTPDT